MMPTQTTIHEHLSIVSKVIACDSQLDIRVYGGYARKALSSNSNKQAAILIDLLFYPEEDGDTFSRNVDRLYQATLHSNITQKLTLKLN
jgi:hypothetical protein